MDDAMIRNPVRLPPLEREDWTDATREVFAVYEGEDGRTNGSKFNVIKMMAHHPDIAHAWLTYNKLLLRNATCRTGCANWRSCASAGCIGPNMNGCST